MDNSIRDDVKNYMDTATLMNSSLLTPLTQVDNPFDIPVAIPVANPVANSLDNQSDIPLAYTFDPNSEFRRDFYDNKVPNTFIPDEASATAFHASKHSDSTRDQQSSNKSRSNEFENNIKQTSDNSKKIMETLDTVNKSINKLNQNQDKSKNTEDRKDTLYHILHPQIIRSRSTYLNPIYDQDLYHEPGYNLHKERRLRKEADRIINKYAFSEYYNPRLFDTLVTDFIKKELNKESKTYIEKTDSEILRLIEALIYREVNPSSKKSNKKKSNKKKSNKKKSNKKKSNKKKSNKKKSNKKKSNKKK